MARPFTEALRRILITKGKGDIVAGAAQLMRVIVGKAAKGDAWALQTILERMEGKAVQMVITADVGGASQLADVDLLQVIEGEATVVPSRKRAKLAPPPPSAADGTPAASVPGRATTQAVSPESGE